MLRLVGRYSRSESREFDARELLACESDVPRASGAPSAAPNNSTPKGIELKSSQVNNLHIHCTHEKPLRSSHKPISINQPNHAITMVPLSCCQKLHLHTHEKYHKLINNCETSNSSASSSSKPSCSWSSSSSAPAHTSTESSLLSWTVTRMGTFHPSLEVWLGTSDSKELVIIGIMREMEI